MRVVLQRVSRASVTVRDDVVGAIEGGLLLLAAFRLGDTEEDLVWMAKKVTELRIFRDADDKMNETLFDVRGSVLLVSQFTLYGDARKGRRPSFIESAPPAQAEALYDRFAQALRDTGVSVATGVFGAMMDVELVNDGPVTMVLDRGERASS